MAQLDSVQVYFFIKLLAALKKCYRKKQYFSCIFLEFSALYFS